MIRKTHCELDFLSTFFEDVVSQSSITQTMTDTLFVEIQKRVLTRGSDILYIDLPKLGKIYDKYLSSGFFNYKDAPECFGISNVRSFRNSWIYTSLLSATVDWDGYEPEFLPDVDDVALTRNVLNLFKKIAKETSNERITNQVKEFVELDKSLPTPTLRWHSDNFYYRRLSFQRSFGNKRLGRVLDNVASRLIPQTEVDILSLVPNHGPGAVSDIRSNTDKFKFPTWPKGVFDYTTFGSYGYEPNYKPKFTNGKGKLLSVPKTVDKSRLITSEPASHQFLQQSLLKWLRCNMHKTIQGCVDFKDQEVSKQHALSASIDGETCTVDLKSASDLMSLHTIERLFSSNSSILYALHSCRTRTIIDGTGTHSFTQNLRKFAGQGSAVTFPIQSLLYTICAITACIVSQHGTGVNKLSRKIRGASKFIRVYGDDIILPSHAYQVLTEILTELDLVVNDSKSHTTGLFREACGMDAYRGYDVSPAYIRSCEKPSSAQEISSLVEVSNNFHNKGLWKSSRYLAYLLPKKFRNSMLITRGTGDGLRLTTFSAGYTTSARKRMCSKHQILTCRTFCVRSKNVKVSRKSSDDLYEYFIQAPEPDNIWSHGFIKKNSITVCMEWVDPRGS